MPPKADFPLQNHCEHVPRSVIFQMDEAAPTQQAVVFDLRQIDLQKPHLFLR
jgi:hypothetical protein